MAKKKVTPLIFLFFLSLSCSTIEYKVEKSSDPDSSIVKIYSTPDRFITSCEVVNDEGARGFMLLILDEQNTVTAAAGMMTNKEGCRKWTKGVNAVLNGGKKIRLIGTGNLDVPRVKGEYTHTFPGLGTFHSNGRSLQPAALTNENGGCFGFYSKECSGPNFPLREE